jgi:hypothetical protein
LSGRPGERRSPIWTSFEAHGACRRHRDHENRGEPKAGEDLRAILID